MPTNHSLQLSDRNLIITMLIMIMLTIMLVMITVTALNQTFNKPIQSELIEK